MLTRLYAHNFRTLVNFELKLDRLNLLVGLNGTGKSSAFDVLRKLQSFLSGDSRTTEVFPSREKTRWVESPMQKFEMDLLIGPESFHYQLTIAHMTDGRRNRVEEEILTVDGNPLFLGGNGKGRLFRDDLSQGPEVSMDWERSGVGVLPSRSDNQKLTAFRQELEHFVIVAVSPTLMEGVSQQEAEFLSPRMENFVSWYRRIAQENIGAMPRLFQDLQRVIPGFSSFSLKSAGEDSKEMKVLFDRPSGRSPSLPLDFRELSDGQRVLIALYSLVYGTGGQRLSLFLDEPDNYVALREIQPWLSTISDEIGESIEQTVIISHHPEIINYMGGSKGRWFSREGVDQTRVTDVPPKATDGLSLAETIARGWEK